MRRMDEVEKLEVGAGVEVVDEEEIGTTLAVGQEDNKIVEAYLQIIDNITCTDPKRKFKALNKQFKTLATFSPGLKSIWCIKGQGLTLNGGGSVGRDPSRKFIGNGGLGDR